MEKILEGNSAQLVGKVLSELEFSHKTYGEAFYIALLGVVRKSGYEDDIRLMVSERLIGSMTLSPGQTVKVSGQVRTYNQEREGKNRLNVVVFAREVEVQQEELPHENRIYLEGFVCKKPVRRTSPLGREICDLMLAVNRMYNKSDYIPCIAWGRNAAYGGELDVGCKLSIEGRIQSREYKKRDDEGNVSVKVAYEVSIIKMEEC
ncbi:single-stranded DNA-binding protein [Anaerovorax odorimutans]|uniref:Single-stranded DNA-binding protein n=1 Tax=Anaerovorax odorimutans TaxID=109327 RepID=A0ABT1RS69_9FIRM|nr:single-stranded DNA-binding protein [Anaerovorax odorimutans]MCQ4638059.1 single-stranded DNA-binding protein [Anaerovorax odorimutans]